MGSFCIGYKAIVIGVSAGGLAALSKLFPCLPDRFPLPVIVVQHVHAAANRYNIYAFQQQMHSHDKRGG